MFRRILAGLDGSEASARALDFALQLARESGAEVHALSVEEHLPAFVATLDEAEDEEHRAHKYFEAVQLKAHQRADQLGVTLELHLAVGHAAHHLTHLAESGGFDLIVLGHRGHSRLARLVLGSTADRVVEWAPCAVLVTR